MEICQHYLCLRERILRIFVEQQSISLLSRALCEHQPVLSCSSITISDEPHGVIGNQSGVTQLLSVFHIDWNLESLCVGESQYLLIYEKSYGVTGKLLNWFSNYLQSCLQRVVVNGMNFRWTEDMLLLECDREYTRATRFAIIINDFLWGILNESQTAPYADDSNY